MVKIKLDHTVIDYMIPKVKTIYGAQFFSHFCCFYQIQNFLSKHTIFGNLPDQTKYKDAEVFGSKYFNFNRDRCYFEIKLKFVAKN